ncbi:Maltose/galactoside acetyltransferase [Penicillium fimorum]|uniref:Maltose/galactoside acetyltransferase n=1 Tax=Penicillium fimorum TaxID=1882269 RepID=A0A9W9Y6F2_9EURO|nr:Maltose/galactoside acetyltransferase [Penicillium fimorum]
MLRIPLALRRTGTQRPTADETSGGAIIPRPMSQVPSMIPVSLLFATRMAMLERVEHRNLSNSARNMELLFHSWSTNPVATYLMINGPFTVDRIRPLFQSFGRTVPPALNSVPDEARSEDDIATMRDALTYEAVRTEADITAVLDALTYDIGLRFLAEAVRTAPASYEIAVYAEILTHFWDRIQRQADRETWQRIYHDFTRAYNRSLMIDRTPAQTVQSSTRSTTNEPARVQSSNNRNDTFPANDVP